MKVRLSLRAQADLEDAAQYYEKIGGEILRNSFLSDVQDTLERLSVFPNIGRVFNDKSRQIRLGKFPYLIVYDCSGNIIRVIAIPHEKRES